MLTQLSADELFKACRILFGADVDVSVEFLYYLQSAGIKSAYRRRALETHPDRAIARSGDSCQSGVTPPDEFIQTHWAYQRLIDFISTRDSHTKRHPQFRYQNPAPQARRHRPRRRTRRWSDNRVNPSGYYYKGVMPRRKVMFGEYLFYSGIIPWEALIKAIVWQRKQRPRFGVLARKWGWLSDAQVLDAIRERRLGEPIGQSILRLKYLNDAQLDTLLRTQRRMQRPFGEFFVNNDYLSASRIHKLLEKSLAHNRKYA